MHPRRPDLPWEGQETVFTRAKEVVSEQHLHSSEIMNLYGEQFVLVEEMEEMGISMRLRKAPR
jgi:hypothetical protein